MTNKIAPHEGNELDMLLAGTKVFAVLEKKKHPALIREYWKHVKTKYRYIQWDSINNDTVLMTADGWPNKRLYFMLVQNKIWYIETFGKEDYQRKMGKVFGYSDEDIEAFISNPPDCNCEKCGG